MTTRRPLRCLTSRSEVFFSSSEEGLGATISRNESFQRNPWPRLQKLAVLLYLAAPAIARVVITQLILPQRLTIFGSDKPPSFVVSPPLVLPGGASRPIKTRHHSRCARSPRHRPRGTDGKGGETPGGFPTAFCAIFWSIIKISCLRPRLSNKVKFARRRGDASQDGVAGTDDYRPPTGSQSFAFQSRPHGKCTGPPLLPSSSLFPPSFTIFAPRNPFRELTIVVTCTRRTARSSKDLYIFFGSTLLFSSYSSSFSTLLPSYSP